ncbi:MULTISPECIES: phosphate ABC transporter ATP-binding protein PstB [Sphingobacterium]|uniref:Phosphate ABC transporter ATP-binding protein PstB n=2 Tax=Sphingobacterium TaxID=28453 RepID=A0ABW5Z228_9SPHI|nr:MULTISPECIES: phosphate ABC transporter ATP-binding protein PstB [Sphingobacterium]MBB2953739.1 phosphate transport system ATP-binding protein [Sphingobacterium sp. JUb56]MCW2262613.1 phosphate transport system ATP-binding protein [Sphingobacterium kitahiroshimense]NJI74495.1 phosphate ABC transporter ATP-binding protein [Sphingobacterium sp. B16(2022)]QQD15902.1 phosphate ABC transporter ATP-binding protein [Sphingobacterium sp. UDSM-2020]TCR12639.1 phosphate ABC transporter ATP-binding pr
MTNNLYTKDLNIWFGSKHVLKGIDIEFPEKKVTALIGPSGCGKSTLLRSFNRMHDLVPDARIEGTVSIDGQNIYEKGISVTDIRKRIGMVFQKANPFPKSIQENIAYGLKLNNLDASPAVIQKALEEVYLWDEVKDDLKKPATRLSGGQQQRLCIARAVALRPDVILMDEPCSALDPVSTLKIEELIHQLKEQYTIVIVTHNMQQAQRVADKTIFMYLGEVKEEGATYDIFNNPQHEITKNYISGHFG